MCLGRWSRSRVRASCSPAATPSSVQAVVKKASISSMMTSPQVISRANKFLRFSILFLLWKIQVVFLQRSILLLCLFLSLKLHYSFFPLKNSSFIPSSQVVFHCLNDASLELLRTTDRTCHKDRSVSARWGVNGKHNNITEIALETSLNSPRLQFSRRETNWSVQRQENL